MSDCSECCCHTGCTFACGCPRFSRPFCRELQCVTPFWRFFFLPPHGIVEMLNDAPQPTIAFCCRGACVVCSALLSSRASLLHCLPYFPALCHCLWQLAAFRFSPFAPAASSLYASTFPECLLTSCHQYYNFGPSLKLPHNSRHTLCSVF